MHTQVMQVMQIIGVPHDESETGAQNLTPVIEYEDTRNQIELTD